MSKTFTRRNLINKDLCENRLYRCKVFKNRKKELSKFDWKKEIQQ